MSWEPFADHVVILWDDLATYSRCFVIILDSCNFGVVTKIRQIGLKAVEKMLPPPQPPRILKLDWFLGVE